jgi:hypothetical protein
MHSVCALSTPIKRHIGVTMVYRQRVKRIQRVSRSREQIGIELVKN